MEMKIVVELRPVKLADGTNGLFHTFLENGDALIESENGNITRATYDTFRFIDKRHNDYSFEDK